jgi:ribosome-associated protein
MNPPARKAERASAVLARRAAAVCDDSKANEIVVLELAAVTDMTDYFVIASGTSDTHVRSVAEHVIETMAAEGTRLIAADGLTQGRWVVLDFGDFVVHVFHPTLRSYYQLERLWGDAPVLALNRQGVSADA